MPVITVAMPNLPGIDGLLGSVADGVAEALGLGQGDVVCVHVPSGMARVSGRPDERALWAVVSIHGSPRGEAKERRAREAAESAFREWSQGAEHPGSAVWTEWLAPSADSTDHAAVVRRGADR